MKKKIIHYLKNKYVIIGLSVLVIIILIVIVRGGSNTNIESATVAYANVIEKVSVTGKISPLGKADLAFQKSGALAKVNVVVGQQIKKGQVLASLDGSGDWASLTSAKATLADMQRSLTPQELALEQSKVNSAQTTLEDVKVSTLNAVHDGYVKAQGAIFNYSDSFFDNPQSANPSLNIRSQSSSFESRINNQRVVISELFTRWSSEINKATASSSVTLVNNSSVYISTIKNFMTDVAFAVNDLLPGNSGLSQTVINEKIATMNSGLALLNQAISAIATAKNNLNDAISNANQIQNQYNLKISGNSTESIAAQNAKVNQAYAEFAKNSVVSPIDGIVTRADPNVGEYVSAGQSGFAVQSHGEYKVEAYVAESDIAKISLGDKADITLDAYGSDVVFKASVNTIDPAETVFEGVPTYKIIILFDNKDDRIRSGMTANIDILTDRREYVLAIPTRAVINDDGKKNVRVLRSNGKDYDIVPVKVGLKGSDGIIEIVSGLEEGTKVVTYIK